MKGKWVNSTGLILIGLFIGLCSSYFLNQWITSKMILTSENIHFLDNTVEVIDIIQDYTEEELSHEYASKLLTQKINQYKISKKVMCTVLSGCEENSKHESFGESIDKITEEVEKVRIKVNSGDKIDFKNDLESFIKSTGEFGEIFVEVF